MNNDYLYFNTPGSDILTAVPIGNGRIGALIFGEVLREQVILNESSVWSGSREDTDREDAAEYLTEIRRLLSQGQNYEAEQIYAEHFTCKGPGSNYAHGSNVPFGCYQVLGRLQISYFQALSSGRESCYGIKEYQRTLDLTGGTARVSFNIGKTSYHREYLSSGPGEVLYIHLTASEQGRINFSVGLDRDECYDIERSSTDTLMMTGQLDDGKGGSDGVKYACALSVRAKGGTVKGTGLRLAVSDADEADIIIAIRTDLHGFLGREQIDERQAALSDLNRAKALSYEQAKKESEDWYRAQAERMTLHFSSSVSKESLPTPERLKRFAKGEEDPGLIELYVKYARHLMIASSQKGGMPSNLQGIWSDEIQTPWNGDWHLNAQQQIYWLVEKAGLSENHLPFLELTRALVEPGTITAQKYYHARGWVVHTMTNPWGFTSPLENAAWGSTTGSSAWQCHHLFEHYLYTRDKAYLQEIYPVMKGAAEFYLDMLVPKGENGGLVISPSSSPENLFLDQQGRRCALCEGAAYDQELVRALFDYCIQAQYVLKNDREFINKLSDVSQKLSPIEISGDGRIREWDRDYPEALLFHRHLSHLWGLYPGDQISWRETPELARAAEKSLLMRGTTTAGWATGYRLCVAARLHNAGEAYGYLRDAFATATAGNLMNLAYHCDETLLHHDLPEIGITKHQFQLDGNQANAVGVLLMLMDDDARILPDGKLDVFVHLLPALPPELGDGQVSGLCIKGGICLSMVWRNGELVRAVFEGNPFEQATVRYRNEERRIELDQSGRYEWQITGKEPA